MAAMNKKKGRNTSKYQVVRGHYYHLVLNFEQILPQLTAKCFERELIGTNDRDTANNQRQPLFDRSRALLDSILTKVEIDNEWYSVFLSILQEFPELEDIRCQINKVLILSSLRRRNSRSVHSLEPNRRYTYIGGVEPDSGIVYLDGIGAGDNLSHAKDVHYEEHLLKTYQSQRSSSCGHDSNDDASRALGTSQHSLAGDSPPLSSDLSPVVESRGVHLKPIQTTSQLVTQGSQSNQSSPLIYPHSPVSKALEKLEEDIQFIEEELSKQRKWLEMHGEKVSKQDDVIKNLRKNCNAKDEIVKDLEKDRAEKEKIIQNLKDKCEEAEKKQTENEEMIKSIQENHKAEIEELEKKIKKLKRKEGDARFDLEKAKTQLAEAELRKEKEVNELRNKYHQEEKLKLELALALKEKEIDLNKKEKELAEEKTKRAQKECRELEEAATEKVQHAEEEFKEREKAAHGAHSRETEELNARIRELETSQQRRYCCCRII